jgi:hypothetical protein
VVGAGKSSGGWDGCLRIEQDPDDGHDGEGKATDKEEVEALAGVGISVLYPVAGQCLVIPPEPFQYFLSQYVRKSTHIGSGTSTPINGSTQRVPEESFDIHAGSGAGISESFDIHAGSGAGISESFDIHAGSGAGISASCHQSRDEYPNRILGFVRLPLATAVGDCNAPLTQ